MSISIKTPEDIAGLRIAGRLAAELLDYLTPFVKPGVSTGELDRLAYDYTVNVQGCIPACLGYCPPGMTPYPATTCISINHVVCHGIPSDKKILKAGDIVNIDVTSIKNGYHGDTSRMFVIGKPTIAGKRLVDLAFGTMWAGIDAVRPGGASTTSAVPARLTPTPTASQLCATTAVTASARASMKNPTSTISPSTVRRPSLNRAWSSRLNPW